MDISYPQEAEAFRQRVREFLKVNLPPDWVGTGALEKSQVMEFTNSWRRTLFENNLLALSWPKEYGGAGLSPL